MSLSVFNPQTTRQIVILFIITFLFKVSLAVYFAHLSDCRSPELSVGYLAKATGDTFSYIGSIENFLTEEEYYFWNGERKVFAGRMPHYGAPYFLFRLFSDKTLASDLMVLLQIFFDALATIFFAKLCYVILNRRIAFIAGYFLYLLSFNFFETARFLTPESVSLSFLVLFLYGFHKYWSEKNQSIAWTANIFLSLAFLLKPYLAPIFLVFWVIYCNRENLFAIGQLKTLIVRSALFALPVILLLLPWFLRNVIVLHKPIPTQESMTAGYKDTEADKAFRRFSGGWGGDATFWDAKSPACYFKLNPPVQCTFTIPQYSLTDKYTMDDIEDARSSYLAFQKNPTPELEEVVVDKFDRLAEIYKRESAFMYYIGSGFIRIRTMIWHTNNYYLPIHATNPCFEPYQLLFKSIQSIIYQLALIFGFAGILWLTAKERISLLFPFIPLFLLFFFSFYVRYTEARYFTHAYPIMLLGLVAVIVLVFSKLPINKK